MPYPPNSGILSLNDPLHDNSEGYNWPDAVNGSGGICTFLQGSYHVLISKQGAFHYCIAGSTNYGNFAYEVQMTILKGDGGGLIFRADGNTNKFYYFRITQDGFYGLYLYSDIQAAHAKTLAIGRDGAIHTGINIPNVLAIVTHDTNISLYVNDQLITSVNDSSYTSGQIGVAATYDTLATEVAFNNARVWTI
jgi:hypothetical protein